MKFRIADLWRLDGTIDRGPYFALGVALTILKMGLDYLVATRLFERDWTPLAYAVPSQVAGLFTVDPDERFFVRILLMVAVPFVVCGVALTVRRLRSAGLPRWLVVLFFAPIPLNLIFYLLLSLLPARRGPSEAVLLLDDAWEPVRADAKKGVLDRVIPASRPFGALAAILLPMPFALAFFVLSVAVFRDYGWAVFIGIPFALPMISVMIYGYYRPRGFGECMALGLLWLAVAYGILLVVAFEGILCLLMALPLALPAALMGAAVGWLIQARPLPRGEASRLMLALVAALPALIGAEAVALPEAPRFAVRTAVEVGAPAERVWAHVVRFDPLPPPDEWVFRAGVAYPVRAEIRGLGVGAVRRCEFSTGPFIEPIEVWDEPRLLRFAVTENPPPLREWSPIADIHPPHLDRFLVAHRGQFLLTPLPGGRTRLEGTTWYRHHLWPASYWQLWSDSIIHRIHRRVLDHIKRSAEATADAQGHQVVPGDEPR